MSQNKFFLFFDKNKFLYGLRIIFLFLLLVLIWAIIGNVYSRYESGADMTAKADIAFFLVESGTLENSISLSGLEPRNNPFIYRINVQNFSSKKRCNVNLKYHISFLTTTNLPLSFEVLYEEDYSPNATNIVVNEEVVNDDILFKKYETNGYHNFTHSSDQTHHYTLVIHFPEKYKANSDDYQGKIDLVTVILDAEQVV